MSLALWIRPGLVRPDGAGYVVYLPSTWLDGDLLFFDQWTHLGMVRGGVIQHKEVTSTNHLGNHWTSGSALFWYPGFVFADATRGVLAPSSPRNGFSLPYNLAVVFGSAVAGLLTLLCGWIVARRYATGGAATIAALGAWFGTPLLFYSLSFATTAHAVSAMACALVIALASKLRDDESLLLLAGLVSGFAAAVRPQNAVIALVPLIACSVREPGKLARFFAGCFVGVLPQLVVSQFLYGSPVGFLTGGGAATPFASFQRTWTWEPIFSWYHGLATWTPFAIVGIAGVVMLLAKDRRFAVALLLVFVAQWMINAWLERSFWGGLSFGQRRFDNCIALFLIGGAVFVDRVGRPIGAMVIAAMSLWTMSLFFAAQRGLDLGAYFTPGELWARQLEAMRGAASQFVPLGRIPPEMRGSFALLLAIALAVAAGAGFALLRLGRRPRVAAAVASAYLLAMALFFAICGLRGRTRIEAFRPLIERNRIYASLPGGADVRFGLLRDELQYLTKSGRTAEAAQTERELRALIAARAAAQRGLR